MFNISYVEGGEKEITKLHFIHIYTQEAKEHAQNEEHLAEEKAKDEKWERQITMYLDKGTNKG